MEEGFAWVGCLSIDSFHKGLHKEKAVMGFANLTPERIREGVQKLKAVIGGY